MKRTLWAGVGYTLGLSTSFYVQSRVRRAVVRYTPPQLRQELAERGRAVADRAHDLVVDLRDAVQEGTATMRDEERELRDRYAVQTDPHRHRPSRLHH